MRISGINCNYLYTNKDIPLKVQPTNNVDKHSTTLKQNRQNKEDKFDIMLEQEPKNRFDIILEQELKKYR